MKNKYLLQWNAVFVMMTAIVVFSKSIFVPVNGRITTFSSTPIHKLTITTTKTSRSWHNQVRIEKSYFGSYIEINSASRRRSNRFQPSLVSTQNNIPCFTRYYSTTSSCNDDSNNNHVISKLKDDTIINESPIIYNYVFGYGSLICPISRAITAPEQINKVATPVIVKGIERIWSKRTIRGMTAMGIQFNNDANCIGVILPVSDMELQQFDEREIGYQRQLIQLNNIDIVPFLSINEYYTNNPYHEIFLYAKKEQQQIQQKLITDTTTTNQNVQQEVSISSSSSILCIWVYVPNEMHPPSNEYPIAQSYVDTIMRGCLSINEAFAREFISTTIGWHPNEFNNNNDDDKENTPIINEGDNGINMIDNDDDATTMINTKKSIADISSHWVDDRSDPIYPRGDRIWSINHAIHIDRLLLQYRPKPFQYRQKRRKK